MDYSMYKFFHKGIPINLTTLVLANITIITIYLYIFSLKDYDWNTVRSPDLKRSVWIFLVHYV